MFKRMIMDTILVVLAVPNQGHTHVIRIAGIVYIAATLVLIEIELNLQDVSVRVMVVVHV